VNADGPPRRLTRAQAKARTRERLLDAAGRVFAERGFTGATVEEIAESAGYSIGALYSNFAGKEELFLELLSARFAERLGSWLDPGQDERIAAATDPLAAVAGLLVELADGSPEVMLLQAEFWLYAVRHPEAMVALASRQAEQISGFERLIAPAIKRLDADVSRAAATSALALFQGLVRQRRVDPSSVSDDLFVQALGWLLAGIAAQSRPRRDRRVRRQRP
jgi:AcrR family transcriptional regulator